MELTRRVLSGYQPHYIDLSNNRMSAAVLLPLYPLDGRYHLLLTKRSEHVEYHKGQISFPGGAEDPTDPDLRFTALRETHEEIGVRPEHVELIGQLDDFVTISNFRIRPYVGLITESPYEFVYDEIEVAEVLTVPVAHLVDMNNIRAEPRRIGDRDFMAHTYLWGDHVVFGATAMILQRFLALLEREGSLGELTQQMARGLR